MKIAKFSDRYVSGIFFFSIITDKEYFELIYTTVISWTGAKNRNFSILNYLHLHSQI